MTIAQTPWRAYETVLKDANGNSIASGGNNRAVTGETLRDSLLLAALAPDLLAALVAVMGRVQPDTERADPAMQAAMRLGRSIISKATTTDHP